MTVFWLIATGMMLLAMIFVLPPLFRRNRTNPIHHDELNVELIRQQLAELESDLNNGKLDRSEYASARKDLERELLYDVSGSDVKPAQNTGKSGRWTAILMMPALPLAAVLLYLQIGSSEQMSQRLAQGAVNPGSGPQAGKQLPSVAEMVNKLAAKLESEPDNPEGWFMLARSYMMLDRYAEAAAAYKQVHTLVGDQPELLVSYADALAMVHDGRLTGKPAQLIQKALELDPNQPQGLWLAGMAADQQADYETAIDYWRRLEPLLKDEPEALQEVRQLIESARSRSGLADEKILTSSEDASPLAATTTGAETPEPATEKGIVVNIDLDPTVRQLAALDDSLFIFAQALEGPPMPLAAVRKQVKDLPLEVTLSDAMAMMPAMRLSNFSEVRIGARISKTGDVKPQSGDLYGERSPVPVDASEPVQITISDQIP